MMVFVCNCRGEIDVPAGLDFGEGVSVREHPFLCSEEGRKEIKAATERGQKIVIAGCTPRIAEKFFEEFHPEIANIREQAAFVGHGVEKIRDIIRGAVEKARVSKGVERKTFDIESKKALVIGSGVAGLEATRRIADFGIGVYLVEKEPFVGGLVAKLDRLYPEGTPDSHTLTPSIFDVVERDNVEVLTNAEVEEVSGNVGNYKVKVKVRDNPISECTLCKRCVEVCPVVVDDYGIERKAIYYMPTHPDAYAIDFEHCNRCGKCAEVCDQIDLDFRERKIELWVGCIIAATGLKPFDASKIAEYGYKRYDNVLTAIEFERKLASGQIKPERVVIINCSGSRDKKYLPYCSRVCCFIGLKEAKLIKDEIPNAEVYLTYIDMRTYGVYESFYNTLREVYGVNFIEGKPAEVVKENGKLFVYTEDVLLGENLKIEADYVVLSTGFVPDIELFRRLKLPVEEGFPSDYFCSYLSVDANPHGIFIAGSASYPKDVTRSIISADYVAGNAISILSRDFVYTRTPIPEINSDICGDCRICLPVCPYEAIFVEEEKIKVDASLCRGCGICTASCAAGANQLPGYTDAELFAQIRGIIGEDGGDKILALLCQHCAYNAADNAGYARLSYPENVMVIRMPCTGRVDLQMILYAFSLGVKGVLVGGCCIGACHYMSGNLAVRKRITALQELIDQFGVDSKRLRLEWIGQTESRKLVDILNEMDGV